MTDAEWAEVRSAMPVPAWLLKRGGRPEAFCHREMLDAVRYLVDNGVKWMAMPVDFPYWRAVYDFFRRWRSCDYVRELHERLRRTRGNAQAEALSPAGGSSTVSRWTPPRPSARTAADTTAASHVTGASVTS
ncbi:transposase [Streptomyces sp. CB01635]|uniref:transposase n=1 Tax=unclassified Streptomyces TaxID=2593676 RepID=UPI001F2AC7AA|nr:transposase [Streptomyces sp. CB01635]